MNARNKYKIENEFPTACCLAKEFKDSGITPTSG